MKTSFLKSLIGSTLLGTATLMVQPNPAAAAGYSPLSCQKAGDATERAICASYLLGQSEARMATLFEWTTSLVAMGQRGAIQDDQRGFIARRAACKADVACIQNEYAVRIGQLQAVMAQIQAKGPF